MNPATDNESPHRSNRAEANRPADAPPPSNWQEALMNLVSSRIALIELESKAATQAGARRAVCVVAVVLCLFFTWALLLAGGIMAISVASTWPWYWIAIACAVLHLLAAALFINGAKSSGQAPFPITRSEFQKDREWINNFQKTRKSNV